jgi:hypothetical protein
MITTTGESQELEPEMWQPIRSSGKDSYSKITCKVLKIKKGGVG